MRIILTLACVCLCACASVPFEEAHQDWSEEVKKEVLKGNLVSGMTIEQVECSIGFARTGRHCHWWREGMLRSSDGFAVVTYKLYGYSNNYGGMYLSARYQNWKLVGWTTFEF